MELSKFKGSHFQSNFYWTLLIFLIVCSSCATNTKKLDGVWGHRDEYMYDYISVSDSLPCDLLLNIRLNPDYPYKNLNIEIMAVDSKYKIFCDTLSILLGKKSQYGAVVSHLLMSDMILRKGDYRFRIKQVMSDTLRGVKEINLRIVPNGKR